jgi:hypothetical protein
VGPRCEVLQAQPGLTVGWLAGSSVGALNSAMIAGSAPPERLEVLRTYWLRGSGWTVPAGMAPARSLRYAANWMSVLQARLFGSPRRVQAAGPRLTFSSFYDLTPTVDYLRKVVDFGRLNSGDLRITVARPRVLEAALDRKNGLLFGNQTFLRLDTYRRLWKTRSAQRRCRPSSTSATGRWREKPARKWRSTSPKRRQTIAGRPDGWTCS